MAPLIPQPALECEEHFTAVQMETRSLCIFSGKSHQTRTVPCISTSTIAITFGCLFHYGPLWFPCLCFKYPWPLSSENGFLLDVCVLLIYRNLSTEVLTVQGEGTALHLALDFTTFACSLPASSPSAFFSHSCEYPCWLRWSTWWGQSDSETLATMFTSQAAGLDIYSQNKAREGHKAVTEGEERWCGPKRVTNFWRWKRTKNIL